MATALLLLLLFFCVFSTITTTTTAQQTSRNSNNTIIPIDSFLSLTDINTTSASWLSPSGRFAFGFYPQDGGFVVGISWFAGIPQKTVVWTAPVLVKQTDSNNFRLRLTGDQGLILQSTQGQLNQYINISEITSGSGVSYASMLDTGNMVLYNAESRVLWQSFDFPSNTLLQGQRLGTGKELYSSASETDYSKGAFFLAMQADGNLALYPTQRRADRPGYAYWATNSFGDNLTLNLDDDGRLCLLNSNGTNIRNLSRPIARNGMTMFYRLTVEINGILTLYSHNLPGRNGDWSVEWSGPDDNCQPVGLCGPNGYCNVMNQEAECLCLPGFNSILTGRLNSKGCKREESCGSETEQSKNTMVALNNTFRWEADIYFSLTSTSEEECESACLNDCNCEAAMFEDQNCRKVKLPLRNAVRQVSNIKVFIKVGTKKNNTNTTSTTPREDGNIKKRKRSKKELKSTILIAGISFVSGFLLVISISGFLVIRFGLRRLITF